MRIYLRAPHEAEQAAHSIAKGRGNHIIARADLGENGS